MTTSCGACRRRLRQPSPDGLGPKCRRKRHPPKPRTTQAPTPTSSTRRPDHDQLTIPETHMPEQPNTLTPDQVNAIVRDMDDPRYPSRITVFCDHCGAQHTGEYMVSEDMSSEQRLAVARKHLVEHGGWEHTDDGDDFCPEHAGSDTTGTDQ